MAGRYDIVINQNKTFKLGLGWTADGVPVNLTGCTVVFNMKPKGGTTTSYTSGTGNISWTNQAGGEFLVTMPPATTDAFTWEAATYEVVITMSDGEVVLFLEGGVRLKQKV